MKFDNRIIVVAMGVIGLYVAFLIALDVNTISDKISNFKMEFVPYIILLVTGNWYILFLRWHLLLKHSKINVPIKENILIYISSFAFSIIPGRVGELIKSQLLKEKFGIPRTQTVPIVLTEQLYTVVGIVIISMLGIWNFEVALYVMSIFGSILVFVFVLISSKTLFDKFVSMASRRKFLSKFVEPLSESYDVIQKSTRGSIFFYASALSVFFWFIEVIVVYLVLLSFGITYLDLFNLIPTYTTSIILGVASFLPLGVGVVEGSLAGFFILLGINVSMSLSLVIVIRIFTRWYTISVGFIALKLIGGLKKNNLN